MSMGTIESELEKEIDSITYVAQTDIGKRREENQDSYGVIETDSYKFYIVADGMGGVRGGALASGLAVETLHEKLDAAAAVSPEIITEAVTEANNVIHQRGNEQEEFNGMGTTVVGLCFVEKKMIVVNVGDSRAYRLRNGVIDKLTEDHTLVSELLRSGAITEELAANHPISHMLTRSLGPAEAVEVDCWYHEQPPCCHDKYLLCSDGLYNLVDDVEIQEALKSPDLETAIKGLIDLANSRGGTDNITIIAIEIGTGYPLPFSPSDTLSGGEIRETVDRVVQSPDYQNGHVEEVPAVAREEGVEEGAAEEQLNGRAAEPLEDQEQAAVEEAADEASVVELSDVEEVSEIEAEIATEPEGIEILAEEVQAEVIAEQPAGQSKKRVSLDNVTDVMKNQEFPMLNFLSEEEPESEPTKDSAAADQLDVDSSGEFEILVDVESAEAHFDSNTIEQIEAVSARKASLTGMETQQIPQDELFGTKKKSLVSKINTRTEFEDDSAVAPEELQGFILVGDPVESLEDEARQIARIKAARRKARQKGPVIGPDDGSGFVIVDEDEKSFSRRKGRFSSGMVIMAVFCVAAISIFVFVDPFSGNSLVKVKPDRVTEDPDSVKVAMTTRDAAGDKSEDKSDVEVKTPDSSQGTIQLSEEELVKTLDTASLENQAGRKSIVAESLSEEEQFLKKEIEVLEARIMLLRATKTNRPDHVSLLKSQQAKLPIIEARYEALELQSIEDGRQIREWLSYKSNLQENRKAGLMDAAEISIASIIQFQAPEIKVLYDQYVISEKELTEHFYTPGNRALLEAKERERELKERYYGLREKLKVAVPEYIDTKIESLAERLEETRPELENLEMQAEQLRQDIEFLQALLSENMNKKNIHRDKLQKMLQLKRQKLENRLRLHQ